MLVYHLLTNPISFGGNSTPASRKKDALEILILISSGRLTSYTDYTRGVEVRIEWKPQAIRELIALAIPQELDMWDKGELVTSALEAHYGHTNFDYDKKDEAIAFCNTFMELVFPNDPIAVTLYGNGDYTEIRVRPVDDNWEVVNPVVVPEGKIFFVVTDIESGVRLLPDMRFVEWANTVRYGLTWGVGLGEKEWVMISPLSEKETYRVFAHQSGAMVRADFGGASDRTYISIVK